MIDPSKIDTLLAGAVAAGLFLSLAFMARALYRDWRALQELRLKERLLPRAQKRKPLMLPDSEDTRLAIAAARRAKAEFDRVERLHDILAKQKYGAY
jgi:hypothetical protein